jgi:CRISPR/Cas system-associated endonuclease/helicase Cas3
MSGFLDLIKTLITNFNEGGEEDDRPAYYPTKQTHTTTFIRNCVIPADRLVSSGEIQSTSDIDGVINKIINKESKSVFTPPYGVNERWYDQLEVVEKAEQTTIVKAPAGFGKTLTGVMWALKQNKKVLWVCPRNIIAETVYETILKEVKALGYGDTSVELYLTNKVQKSNNGSKGFDCDIIVTNIDNYLKPSLDNNEIDKLHMINVCPVIFDEYHEFVCENALFGCFVNLMKVRNRLTNSESLLLSATPINLTDLWDGLQNKTKILPENSGVNRHYNAAHNKSYSINIINEEVNNISERIENEVNKNTSTLCVINSTKNVQLNKGFLFDGIFHAKYDKCDKENIINSLNDNYGKNSERVGSKLNFIGTKILQTSMDISFLNLIESVISPESTLQRIGRIDRWGDYGETPKITIFNTKNRSEEGAKNVDYSKNLTIKWFSFLKEKFKNVDKVTLNELYVLYNDFSVIEAESIELYINGKYSLSKKNMRNIYPKKQGKHKEDEPVYHKANSNRLRSSASSNEIFYVVLRNEGKGLSEA